MSEEEQSIEDMIALLKRENDNCVAELEAVSPAGPGSMENAFDALKMVTFFENIALHLGCDAEARLDFEGRRGVMISKIVTKMDELREAHEAAQRRAVLTGNPPTPAGVTPMPNRAQRRR